MSRSLLREVASKVLYQTYIFDLAKIEYDIDELILEEVESIDPFVKELVSGVKLHQKEINDLANKNLINWEIDRLSKIDKAILSISIYELLYTDTDFKIIINEALNLSHKYSDPSVVKMINACLDAICKKGK